MLLNIKTEKQQKEMLFFFATILSVSGLDVKMAVWDSMSEKNIRNIFSFLFF